MTPYIYTIPYVIISMSLLHYSHMPGKEILYNPIIIYSVEVMNMGMILSYTAPCGATVNFSDEGYINSSEQELAFRRENMERTAGKIAQEIQLKLICQDNHDDCTETS